MAIKFNCPHCQHPYRLKDELAGRRAQCKNPDCRQHITIPAPATVPPTTPDPAAPARDAATIEADALSALSDDAPTAEAPATERVIPVTCRYCDHRWTVAWAMGGKNVLCPNPECRQRVKVPEPKEDVPLDWRQQKTKLPTLAKENFEKLEGVQDAADVGIVKRKSLEEAGALDEEVEPRPLKDKVKIVLATAGLLAAVAAGVWYWRSSSVEKGEDRFMADARTEFDRPKTAEEQLTPADAGLAAVLLHMAEAEHLLLHNTPKHLPKALEAYGRARAELQRQPPGPARNAVAAELAQAALRFGGTDEQVRDGVRCRWVPDAAGVRSGRLTERVHTVHEELQQTLALLGGAEFECKAMAARRLTRDLARKGHPGFAAETVALALFGGAERDEGRAVVALEVLPVDRELARRTADDLKAAFGPAVKGIPYAVSAPALFTAVRTDKPPAWPAEPAPGSTVLSEPTLLVHVGLRLQDGKWDAALDLVRQGARPESRVKALALCAELMPPADRGKALDAAVQQVAGMKGRTDVFPPGYHLLRLAQVAAEAGRPDAARALADGIADDGLRAWAVGDAARVRALADPKGRADEAWAEVPNDPKKVRAGHLWGVTWVYRQNTRESGDKGKEKKAAQAAAAAVRPFALAGIALGLKDR
ncbi:MAG: hypothetical protein C0501_08370 [Isosphaera sp.]|nr:hypothetical protein [Isosphaera sp.]